MAIGDEIGLSEDLYQTLIGRYVAAIEVVTKRSALKDQHIAKLETQLAQLEAAQAKEGPQEGDVIYLGEGEEPPATAPKGKKK
jgi:hypothetical protein